MALRKKAHGATRMAKGQRDAGSRNLLSPTRLQGVEGLGWGWGGLGGYRV